MPTRRQLLHSWTTQLQGLVPIARITRLRTWAQLSLGLLWSGQIALLKIAATVPGPATDLSRVRDFRRWLANPAVDVGRLWTPVVRALLAGRREVRLVFDPTPQAGHATLLIVGIVVHRRILPVAWRAVPQQRRWPARQIVLLRAMCQQLAGALPAGAQVTLVADRGITSAAVIDLCQELGWHFVLRLTATPTQSATVRLPAGTECPVWSLVPVRGGHWYGSVALFQAAGWRTVQLTIVWPLAEDEPWLLLSDLPPGRARQRDYRCRVHCEATYLDSKSRGWHLEASKVTQLDRFERLFLAFALALWWAELLGLRVIRSGRRRRFDRSDRRDLSLIRLGLRWLSDLLDQHRLPPLLFRLQAGRWICRWSY
jgi:hypothetical protein